MLKAGEELHKDGVYWSEEIEELSHRRRVHLWVQGPVPNRLDLKCIPMIVDWDATKIDLADERVWPLMNSQLSDLVVFKIVSSKTSQRDRGKFYPMGLQTSGDIIIDRPNVGPAANKLAHGRPASSQPQSK